MPASKVDLKVRDFRLGVADMMRSSQVIVAGEVIDRRVLSVHLPGGEYSGSEWWTSRYMIRKEVCLEGWCPPNIFPLYRIDCARNCPGDQGTGTLHAGTRRVFLLVQEGTILRSMVDLRESEARICTGRHDRVPAGVDLPHRISALLLTPGHDFSPDDFAGCLSSSRYESVELVGFADTFSAIRPFLQSSSKHLRDQACLELAGYLFDVNGCLQATVNAPSATTEERLIARQRLNGLAESKKQLLKWIESGSVIWLRATARSDTPDGVFDLLRVLAQHEDQRVRAYACKVGVTMFPSRPLSECH